MPETVLLLTGTRIQKEEFIEFVRTLQIPETKVIQPSGFYDAQFVKGKQNIWVALHNEELSFYEDEQMMRLQQKLGNLPQTLITLDISKTEPTSQELAVEFIARFAERWPCVIDNNQAGDDFRVYSVQEVLELRKRGEDIIYPK